MSILVVDDSIDSLRLIQVFLKSAGYKDVITAQSVVEAYEILAKRLEIGAMDIDLILMDIIMPDIDGIEACRTIKKNALAVDVPVIMVTAKTEKENLQLAFSVGAIDYIIKPIDKIELMARVHSALRLKHEMDRRKARELELLEVTRQLEEANESLRNLSLLDGLTEIANRRHFDEIFFLEFGRAKRNKTSLTLLLVDIDFFKAYNDSYGHLKGDECLKNVTSALKKTLKRQGDFIARYGGEEFAVILPNTDLQGALSLVETMKHVIQELKIEHCDSQCSKFISVSIGVSTMEPPANYLPGDLIQLADKALYRAKKTGRNKAAFCCDVEFPQKGVL
ncbi:MAG: GGDEF domain-containing response regulator [Desulfitobacteriaceae bacterium]